MNTDLTLFSLQGKRALVTGATGYLGSAMAMALAKAGAHILVNSRSLERADELVKKITDTGYSAEAAVFDVTNKQQVEAFISKQENTPVHILINNAYSGGAGSIELSNTEQYAESYDITVLSAHRLIKSLLPNLRLAVTECGDASIINIASMYGVVSPDQGIYDSQSGVNPPFYGASKAALIGLTRYAACEFGKESIRTNSISPGPFPSKAVQNNLEFIQKLANKVPMARIGQAKEIQGPILFLASQASSFVNGANLAVDGGWTCW